MGVRWWFWCGVVWGLMALAHVCFWMQWLAPIKWLVNWAAYGIWRLSRAGEEHGNGMVG